MASFRLAYIKPATMFVAAVLIGSACCGEESLRVERAAHSAAERAIAAKLQQPLSWSHEGEPLEMAIGVLSERGISHLIEYPAMRMPASTFQRRSCCTCGTSLWSPC